MRAVHRRDLDAAYRLIDAAHISLGNDRTALAEVASTLTALTDDAPPPEVFRGPPLTVGELARRLGVHPATLRTWESAGILRPARDRPTGYRVYSGDAVRDAEIARQLRRGGYPLRNVAQFIDSLRASGGPGALRTFLDAWQLRLITRSRHLLAGAAQLDAYLTLVDQT